MCKMMGCLWRILIPLLVVGVAGCGGGDDDQASPTPSESSPEPVDTPTATPTLTPTPGDDDVGDDDSPEASPTISIVSPSGGAVTVPFDVIVSVENFALEGSSTSMDGLEQGHWHLWIDGAYQDYSETDTYTVEELEAGGHTAYAQLVQSDHQPLVPDVQSESVSFTVETEAVPAAISILSPAVGDSLAGDFDVTVSVEGFTLIDTLDGAAQEGEGHWHLLVDGTYYEASASTTISVVGLSAAEHTLQGELVYSDHTALEPPVLSESVNVTVVEVGETPTIDIVAPTGGPVGLPFTLEVAVENFILDPKAVGGEAQPGRGHWLLYVDGGLQGYSAYETLVVDSLSPGLHTLQVELVTSDHQPLDPPAESGLVAVELGEPELSISSPQGGEVWQSFDVVVAVKDFVLDPEALGSAENEDGHGHWHLFVDGAYLQNSGETSTRVEGLPIGTHTLLAELRSNDHSPLDPPVLSEEVTVEVVPTPTITINAPVEGAEAFEFDVVVAVDNFSLNGAALGGEPVDGEGHWHLYVDDQYSLATAELSASVAALSPGAHVLQAELVQNDHSSLREPVWSEQVTIVTPYPEIAIQSPVDGTTVSSDQVLEVAVAWFILDDNVGGSNETGHGHYHVYLNGDYMGPSSSTLFELGALDAGPWELRVVLAENDHTELEPVADDTITFTVEAEAPTGPTITILSPETGADIFEFTMTVAVANFTLDPDNLGGEAVAGSGHWHLELDGVYWGASGTTSMEVTGLDPGPHSIQAQLMNNDHTPLDPPVFSQVVEITSPSPSITILSPSDETTITGEIQLEVAVDNFYLSDAQSEDPVSREGQYRVYIDGQYDGVGTGLTYTLPALDPGTHKLEVRLAGNDAAELDPVVSAVISVVLVASSETDPRLGITDPSNDGVLNSSSWAVEIEVHNFELDPDAIGGLPQEGGGHYHVYLDGVYQGASAEDTYLLTRLSVGEHSVKVQLVQNDHTPLSPDVYMVLAVTVPDTAPQVLITSPEDGAQVEGDVLRGEVWTENFELNPDSIGGAPVDGEGHYLLYLDGDYVGAFGGTSFEVEKVDTGQHTLRVELVGNDQQPLSPEVVDEIQVDFVLPQ